jgi:hypothetical protein
MSAEDGAGWEPCDPTVTVYDTSFDGWRMFLGG